VSEPIEIPAAGTAVAAEATATPDPGTVAGLLATLDLRPDPAGEPDTFQGDSQRQPWGRVYGGQALGQSIVAAQRTVDPGRPVHSMHAYFLRAGDDHEPITFAVERLRDGTSFSARRVQALQFGRPILSMIASFQRPATGLDHQQPPPQVPDPETLPTLQERFGQHAGAAAQRWLRRRPMDLRHVEDPVFVTPATDHASRQCVWMRSTEPMPDDPALHAAVLAYASDYSMLEPVLRPHGLAFADPGLKLASLDHAMWFHRAARADGWLLYVLDSPSAQGARGLGTARVYTRDGILVATVVQEGMVRLPRTSA
jgi:acyl-CoA thioesterase-2